MPESTLDQVQRLVSKLSPQEQALLLASLAHHLADVATTVPRPAAPAPAEPSEAWEHFFQLGDALAANGAPTSETLTSAVLAMRH